ncbi:MAG: transcriptional regulator HexR [Succinivibrionaceae bacterium]
MGNFLDNISANYSSFSPKEKKIADVVVNSPQSVISASIAQLAKLANVSEPTVHRFCQKIKTQGFPDFKLKLAQSLAKGISYSTANVEENDSTENYTKKIFDASIAALNDAKKQIDCIVIQRCVDILSCAKRITFCGYGDSATIAHDMMKKFYRFNIPCNCFEDPVMMRMSANNSSLEDVFIIISLSGETKSLVEIAKQAKKRHSTIIGMTARDTPLAEECTLLLPIAKQSKQDIFVPMASRLAQLALVDVLSTGLMLRRGPQFIASLRTINNELNNVIRDANPTEKQQVKSSNDDTNTSFDRYINLNKY